MAEITCYGLIAPGFSDQLRRDIRDVPDHEPIELHISSPGGVMSEGVTAYNILRSTPHEVHAYMDGDAFSAATLLICAADYAEMPSNALLMIHEPWIQMLSPATIDELDKATRYLKATRGQAIEIYHDKTKLSKRSLAEMMRDETYMTSEEALGKGFVNNVTHASHHVHNLRLDDYQVRDKERLARMLGQRKIVRDVSEILKNIGV
ncbi:MAG: Clp protease ClpP [Planctomycetaceae bacterium]|nr:Clp protease ClpP [Planctomycetaceae bacterium]